jgi:hypothetical protein
MKSEPTNLADTNPAATIAASTATPPAQSNGDIPRGRMKPGQWSIMPTLVRDSGAVGRLTVGAARCFIAMIGDARWNEGGKVIISQEVLGKATSLTPRAVRSGMTLLVELGLIQRLHRGGGREGDAGVYRVVSEYENRLPDSGSQAVENRKSASGSGAKRMAASGSEPETCEVRTGRKAHENRKVSTGEAEAGFLPLGNKEDQGKQEKEKKPREPDPIWDTWVELFALKPVTRAELARVGGNVRDLKLKQATPDEIRQRFARYGREWPNAALTPEALVKHWDYFAQDHAKAGGNGRFRRACEPVLGEEIRVNVINRK